MGTAQTVLQRLIMKHLQGTTDDGYWVLQCESAGVDFSFKGQRVGMFSNTIACSLYCFWLILHTGAAVITLGNFNNFIFILIPWCNF